MADQAPNPNAHLAHARLIANAWQDPKVMTDLTSGDQDKIKKQFKAAGIEVPKNVKLRVHQHSDDEFHVVIPNPPAAHVRDLMSAGGGAHKCYGPFCGCGPY